MTSATRTWTRLSPSRVKVSPADTPSREASFSVRTTPSSGRSTGTLSVRWRRETKGASASWLGTTSTVQSTVYRSVSAEAVSERLTSHPLTSSDRSSAPVTSASSPGVTRSTSPIWAV